MAKARHIKAANFLAWGHDSRGYIKPCRDCGRPIYLKIDYDGVWRPYASWIAGDAARGEWILHDCEAAVHEPDSELSQEQLREFLVQIIMRDMHPEVLANLDTEDACQGIYSAVPSNPR